MNLGTHPARVAAAVGAVVVAGTTTVMALTMGTASADEPGRCTQNVNVREEPSEAARVVALCPGGTPVTLGAEQDGFVMLAEQGGWASKEFVTADGTGKGAVDGQGADEQAADAATEPASDDAAADDAAGQQDGTPQDGDHADAARSSQSEDDSAGGSNTGGNTDGHAASDDTGAGDTGHGDARPARNRVHGIAGLLG